MDFKKIENSNRLVFALSRHSDEYSLKVLSRLLNYEIEQLKTDIEDLKLLVSQFDLIEGGNYV